MARGIYGRRGYPLDDDSIGDDISKKLNAKNSPMDMGAHRRCNFLWPYKEGSIEEAVYEIANGLTEEYRLEWFTELAGRIEKEKE